jgi:hypothetical protein
MLAAIGETLEKEGDDEVMGVVVNARKGFYRIGLWTKSCSNQEVLKAIGYVRYHLLIIENASRKFLNFPTRKRSNSMPTLTLSERVDRLVRNRECSCRVYAIFACKGCCSSFIVHLFLLFLCIG